MRFSKEAVRVTVRMTYDGDGSKDDNNFDLLDYEVILCLDQLPGVGGVHRR